MTAQAGYYGSDAVKNRFLAIPSGKGKNEKYFMQVKQDEPNKGRMQVWNEEFGQDRAVGYLDPGSNDFVPDKTFTKGARQFEKDFFTKKSKCSMLVVNKQKSFDKSFSGDFNLENGLINRKNKDDLQYIYTGLQIIKPDIFQGIDKKIFSINTIWNKLIESKELYGFTSNNNFLHVSTLNVYENLLKKLNIK